MLFLDVKDLKSCEEKLESLIESSSLERIVVEVTKKMTVESLESLTKLNYELQFIFVGTKNNFEVIEKLSFNFEKQDVIVEWKDLTEKSREWLLNNRYVLFQNVEMTVGELFTNPSVSITADVLAFLCNNTHIRINCDANEEEVVNYIERKIINKQSVEPLTIAKFIEKLRDYDNPVNKIVVSDPAGSGKTSFFKKLFNDLKKETNEYEKPKNFTIFVELKRYQKELKEYAGENFVEFIAKIKKFDALTKALFEEKYKKGESVTFFDGFDEISADCSENTKKLLSNFEEHEDNQIFISTRAHFERDLELLLKVDSNKLQILSQNDQIEYLIKFWENPNLSQEFVKKCAQELVNKISQILSSMADLIGVPLILVSLAETYKDEINEHFEKEVDKLNIYKIYSKIVIEKLMEYSHVKNDKNLFQFWKTSQHPLQVHEYLAISYLISYDFDFYSGLDFDRKYWTNEKIERFSIVSFDNNRVVFHHKTHAEYLVAYYLFEKLKSAPSFTAHEVEFLHFLLNDSRSEILRLFLNAMLENEEHFDEFKFSNTPKDRQICDILNKPSYLLRSCFNLFGIFDYFTNLIYKKDKTLFRNLIQIDYSRALSLAFAKDVKTVEIFLKKMFESGIDFEKFLSGSILNSNYNLHKFALYAKTHTYFEILWTKCKTNINNDQKMKKIFMQIEEGQNIMQNIVDGNPKTFKFIFDLAHTQIFADNPEEFEVFVLGINARNGSLATEIASSAPEETIRFFFEQIKIIFGVNKLKETLKTYFSDKHLLILAMENKNQNSFETLWQIIEDNLESNEVAKIIENKSFSKFNCFHCVNILCHIFSSRSTEKLEFWLQKIKFHLNHERFQALLLWKDGDGNNALMVAAFIRGNESFPFIFERFYCENLKIEDFATETDVNGESLFHKIVRSSDILRLKTLIPILKAKIPNFNALFDLKTKTGGIFHQIVKDFNVFPSKKFKFVANLVQNECGDEKLRKMLKEKNDLDLIPLHSSLVLKSLVLEGILNLFQNLVSIYEQYFDRDQMKVLLNLKEKTFYEKAFEGRDSLNCKQTLAKYDINIEL